MILIFTSETEALKNLKKIPLRDFHCLRGGKNRVLQTYDLSARVLEILGIYLKF